MSLSVNVHVHADEPSNGPAYLDSGYGQFFVVNFGDGCSLLVQGDAATLNEAERIATRILEGVAHLRQPQALSLRRICSWCRDVLAEGEPGAETTHTICDSCSSKVQAEEKGAAV